MNKIIIILILTMYLIMLLFEYLKYRTYKKSLKKKFKEDIYEIKYKLLVEDIKELEQYHQTGGTYIIPVEVINIIYGIIEDWENLEKR